MTNRGGRNLRQRSHWEAIPALQHHSRFFHPPELNASMATTLLVSCRPPSPLTADPSPRSAPSNLSRSLSFGFTRTEEFDGSRRPTAVVIPDRRGDWRTNASLFPFLKSKKTKDTGPLKKELLEAIAPLDRGADATQEDQESIDQIAQQLESVNAIKEPLKSGLLNGKWELIYTTSSSVLQRKRPKFLRPNGKIYQAINADTLRAQNMETWPFFNQVTANLVPLNARRVAVRFDYFKIAGLIPIKAPGRGRGELEITYLDEEMRISRGDKGNLFILKMVDPSYRVPT